MKRRFWHLTLREWWHHITAPLTLLVMGAVIALTALAGPFGTLRLGFLPRLIYWAAMVPVCYSMGYLLYAVVDRTIPGPRWRQIWAFALGNGLAVSALVLGLNGLLGWAPDNRAELALTAGMIFAAAALTSALMTLISAKRAGAATPPPKPDQSPILLDRLSPPLRGPLVALSAEDHYTRIRTTRGEALVLVALRDAIREAAPVPGQQVHRSHWVALDQITRLERSAGKGRLHLRHGDTIPVSRGNMAALKDLGF